MLWWGVPLGNRCEARCSVGVERRRCLKESLEEDCQELEMRREAKDSGRLSFGSGWMMAPHSRKPQERAQLCQEAELESSASEHMVSGPLNHTRGD